MSPRPPSSLQTLILGLAAPRPHVTAYRLNQRPSVGATANLHRAFLPRLTESTAGSWIKATTQLFLNLSGEENGRMVGDLCFLFVFVSAPALRGGSPPLSVHAACQAPRRTPVDVFCLLSVSSTSVCAVESNTLSLVKFTW